MNSKSESLDFFCLFQKVDVRIKMSDVEGEVSALKQYQDIEA